MSIEYKYLLGSDNLVHVTSNGLDNCFCGIASANVVDKPDDLNKLCNVCQADKGLLDKMNNPVASAPNAADVFEQISTLALTALNEAVLVLQNAKDDAQNIIEDAKSKAAKIQQDALAKAQAIQSQAKQVVQAVMPVPVEVPKPVVVQSVPVEVPKPVIAQPVQAPVEVPKPVQVVQTLVEVPKPVQAPVEVPVVAQPEQAEAPRRSASNILQNLGRRRGIAAQVAEQQALSSKADNVVQPQQAAPQPVQPQPVQPQPVQPQPVQPQPVQPQPVQPQPVQPQPVQPQPVQVLAQPQPVQQQQAPIVNGVVSMSIKSNAMHLKYMLNGNAQVKEFPYELYGGRAQTKLAIDQFVAANLA